MRLIATKPLTYATRQLVAGDAFDAAPMHGRLLIGIKKARAPNERMQAELPLAARKEQTTGDQAPDEDVQDIEPGPKTEGPHESSHLTRTPHRRRGH